MLEQSNPFKKAEDMLDMMKSYQPTDAATDTASEVQSIPTEQLDVWSVGDPSERGSDDGGWPTFDDDTGSVRKAAKNIEVCTYVQCEGGSGDGAHAACTLTIDCCKSVFTKILKLRL